MDGMTVVSIDTMSMDCQKTVWYILLCRYKSGHVMHFPIGETWMEIPPSINKVTSKPYRKHRRSTTCFGGTEEYNNILKQIINVFKGDVIPFKAIISGTYYLDYLGTPELTYIEGTPQRNAVKTTSLKNDKLPVVCTGDTADMIVKQDGAAHKNLTIKLTKLAKEVLGNNATRVVELMKSWGPFIPIMSKYNCQPLNLEVSGDHGYTFKYMATFKEYKPIIFMDAMGMGMFNYKRSFVTKHTGHASGNPIRFCGGSAYTGDMFTVEPRPKCPLTSTKENRYHGHAVITV
ncbi:hypothetical protein RRG08_036693, partial [Elysia crispata]